MRANSDSQEDQEVKLKVKEAVVDYIRPALSESDSLSESRAILEAESDNVRNVAIKTLRDNGFMEDVSVYFEKSYFPVKSYGDVTFPAGYYEAFRVDIGDAEGKNWWCVLYPPLCFVDAVYGVVPEDSKKEQTDIDVVGLDTTENKAILGECKFRNTPMDKKQLEELMDRDGLIDKRYKVAEYHLYSLSGFTDWVKDNAVALNVRLIPIEDMYN